MNVYLDLEDSLYGTLITVFPDWRIIQAYNNGPEPQTPYLAIDIRKMDLLGQGYTSSVMDIDGTGVAQSVTVQDFEAKVRFEVIGKNESNTEASEMATMLLVKLRTAFAYDTLERNRLSVFMQPTVRRIPLKRETDMYMVYQHEYTFAFSCYTKDDTPDYIATVGYEGVYTDAGREPDHIIETLTDVTTQP